MGLITFFGCLIGSIVVIGLIGWLTMSVLFKLEDLLTK